MNETGTKCFDILSMFHGWLLRVLLQYSSPPLILISHYSIDCLCLQRDACCCVSTLNKNTHTHTHTFLCSNVPIHTLRSNLSAILNYLRDVTCMCLRVMCSLMCTHHHWGALKFHIFVSFWLFFSLGEKKKKSVSAHFPQVRINIRLRVRRRWGGFINVCECELI